MSKTRFIVGGDADGRPLLGTAAAVSARTSAELAARFAETYVGANLTVVVVGDVEARATREAVARAFAAVPRGRPARRPTLAMAGSGARVVLSPSPVAEPELVVGFRLPAPNAEDAAVIDLLAALLARGDDARLARELAQNRGIVDSVRGFTSESRGGALLALVLSPAPRRLEAAAQGAVDEALRLGRDEISAEELARARTAVEGDLARGEAGVEGHARRLGFEAAIAGDLDYGARYRARLDGISAAELRAAAAKLLRADDVTLARIPRDCPEPSDGQAAAPISPAGPVEPISPAGPVAPASPVAPVGPGGPAGPAQPASAATSVQMSEKPMLARGATAREVRVVL